MKRKRKGLSLNRATIRTLASDQLSGAAGGWAGNYYGGWGCNNHSISSMPSQTAACTAGFNCTSAC